MIWIAFLLAQSAAATQVERGDALFNDSTKGCVTCHALKGKGIAVGPDLRNIGKLSTQVIVSAIKATSTAYVQTAKAKGAGSFPAMPASRDDKTVQVYDLSKTPPELRKFDKGDVTLGNHDGSWKHPPARAGFNSQEMADIVAYIRYAATGAKKPVDPSDIP